MKKRVTIDDYVALIESVLERLPILKDKYWQRGNENIDEIAIQLNFILDVAKNGNSFKRAMIERNKEFRRKLMEKNPISDGILRHAIGEIYSDLEFHDYNVGRISQEVSLHLYDLISAKEDKYEKYFYEQNLHDERLKNNFIVAHIASNNLWFGKYYRLWVKHGIKNLQYFFLSKAFSFTVHSNNEIELIPEKFEQQLHKDIERIAQFYETDEAEGTHMYLNPVKIEEIDGKTHLVDLKGNIVAYPQK